MEFAVFLVLLSAVLQTSKCYYIVSVPENVTDDPGIPLILTPLIEQNKIQDALAAAQTHFNGFKNQKSYAGYFTVNKPYDSNLFFWFFPARNDYATAPVVLWLQGARLGDSSLIGLFAENGPFRVKSKHGLELRKFSWTESLSVIYMDSPVGSGYSFTNNGYAQNQTQVGDDLYSGLQQFFQMFPEIQKNAFYVAGESYVGKYAPAIAYTIHTKNPGASLKINLQGLFIGNGFSDPEHQIQYGEYLYQIGLVDAGTRDIFQNSEQQAVKYIQGKQFDKAFQVMDELLYGDLSNTTSTFANLTGFGSKNNLLYPVDPSNELAYLTGYVQREDVRASIHVGNATFHVDKAVEENLLNDYMQSVAPWMTELLSNYRVLYYSGQLDMVVPYSMVVNFLQNLQFSGADDYKKATRSKWYVGTDLAGYVKQGGNLTEVLVRDAGQMAIADQPQWCYDLISRFTINKAFN